MVGFAVGVSVGLCWAVGVVSRTQPPRNSRPEMVQRAMSRQTVFSLSKGDQSNLIHTKSLDKPMSRAVAGTQLNRYSFAAL